MIVLNGPTQDACFNGARHDWEMLTDEIQRCRRCSLRRKLVTKGGFIHTETEEAEMAERIPPVGPGMHDHQWFYPPLKPGQVPIQQCRICGGVSIVGMTPVRMFGTVVVQYDEDYNQIMTGDGKVWALDELIVEEQLRDSNPAMSVKQVQNRLRQLSRAAKDAGDSMRAMGGILAGGVPDPLRNQNGPVSETGESYARGYRQGIDLGRQQGYTDGHQAGVSEGYVKGYEAAGKNHTSEKALELILEEIKHDDDPFAAAGRWITSFTNAVTDITREIPDE